MRKFTFFSYLFTTQMNYKNSILDKMTENIYLTVIFSGSGYILITGRENF